MQFSCQIIFFLAISELINQLSVENPNSISSVKKSDSKIATSFRSDFSALMESDKEGFHEPAAEPTPDANLTARFIR
jgi:hypothetical protein